METQQRRWSPEEEKTYLAPQTRLFTVKDFLVSKESEALFVRTGKELVRISAGMQKTKSCLRVCHLSLKLIRNVLESIYDLIFLILPNLQTPNYTACDYFMREKCLAISSDMFSTDHAVAFYSVKGRIFFWISIINPFNVAKL